MEVMDQFKALFEPDLVLAIEKHAKLVSLKAGDVILDIGQIVRTMPIILSGSVNVSHPG